MLLNLFLIVLILFITQHIVFNCYRQVFVNYFKVCSRASEVRSEEDEVCSRACEVWAGEYGVCSQAYEVCFGEDGVRSGELKVSAREY